MQYNSLGHRAYFACVLLPSVDLCHYAAAGADLKESDEMVKKRGDPCRVNNISGMFPKAHDHVIKKVFNI